MRCGACGTENSDHTSSCVQCAVPMGNRCAGCNTSNPPQGRFCGNCGLCLDAQPTEQTTSGTSAVKPVPKAGATEREAERRQITVLFCDVVGSTELSERLDPEDLRHLMGAYHHVCSEEVRRYDGHISQYLGDGVLIFFGYPVAHEDDVQRAILTALAILEGMKKLNLRLQQENETGLSVRMGIHTGQVVIGEVGEGTWRAQMALGLTPNLAARVQNLAESNTLLITAATHRLVAPHFICQDLGVHSLKGIAHPLQVFQVLGESGVETRMQAAGTTGIMAFVGREREAHLLMEHWQLVQAGNGQVILLTGEPGIGKSRLIEELKARLAEKSCTVLESYCLPYQGNTAFAPISQLLQRECGLVQGDSPQEKLAKLQTTLEGLGLDPTETVPLLAPLISVPSDASYTPLVLDPLRQRQLTLTTLTTWLTGTTKQKPVLFIMEDLHWADPSSLELLGLLFSQVCTCRMMLLLTFRPEFRPPWPLSDGVHSVALTRLVHEQTAALATHVAHNRSLPNEVLQEIIKRTDGVPLFVEEMTRMLLESGFLKPVNGSYELTGPLPAQAIPTTVQDSLMARLDRLGLAAKTVAQIGATIGREFRHDVLHAVAELDEAELERDLSRLIEADLVIRDGLPPQAIYLFNHALIQDAAYATLLRDRRQGLHARIASVLEAQFPETATTMPELLAHHLTAADIPLKAIPYWQQAGIHGAARAAHAEAGRHFAMGLDLLSPLPENTTRHALELGLRVHSGLSLSASRGYAAQEVEATYNRAWELCGLLGNTAELYPVLRGLCTFYVVRLNLDRAKDLADQCLRLGRETERADYLISGYTALGYTLVYLGELEAGRKLLAEAVKTYRSRDGEHLRYPEAQDPAVACLCLLSHVTWVLGDVRMARQYNREALEQAEKLKRPFDQAYAHCFAAMFDNIRGDPASAVRQAGITIEISQRHGFAVWLGAGTIQLGIAKGALGETAEAIGMLPSLLAAWQQGGAELNRPYFLAGLAKSYRAAGKVDNAIATIEEAIDHATRHREHWYDAELYRIRGELLALQGGTAAEAAVADLARAVYIAHHQGARLFELRAAVRFHEHCLAMGQPERSRAALESVYATFAGTDLHLAELQKAKALLSCTKS